jgi:hypothetical protein
MKPVSRCRLCLEEYRTSRLNKYGNTIRTRPNGPELHALSKLSRVCADTDNDFFPSLPDQATLWPGSYAYDINHGFVDWCYGSIQSYKG